MFYVLKVKSVSILFLAMVLSLTIVSTSMSIVPGSIDRSYHNVGQVGVDPPGNDELPEFNCTGTLIGTNIVLTADACLAPDKNESGLTVFIGSPNRNQLYHVWHVVRGLANGKLAMLHLDRDVDSVEPMPLCTAQTNFAKLGVHMVGYGGDTLSNNGWRGNDRHSATTRIESSSATFFSILEDGPQIQSAGDYGSPAIISTNTTKCVAGIATGEGDEYVRPDAHIELINAAANHDSSIQWVEPSELRCTDDVEGYDSCSVNDYWSCYINPGESEADGELVCRWGSKSTPSDCAEDICN